MSIRASIAGTLLAVLGFGVASPTAAAPPPDPAAQAELLLAEAVAVAPVLTCGPVSLVVDPASKTTAFSSTDCSVHVRPDVLDPGKPGWWAPFILRHEVAHLAMMADGQPHGHDLAFRATLAGMLRPLGIVEEYADASAEIPTAWWVDGVRQTRP